MHKELNHFPNGLDSFLETHFNVVDFVIHKSLSGDEYLKELTHTEGKRGLLEVARNLTEEFEKTVKCKHNSDKLEILNGFLINTFKQLNDGFR